MTRQGLGRWRRILACSKEFSIIFLRDIIAITSALTIGIWTSRSHHFNPTHTILTTSSLCHKFRFLRIVTAFFPVPDPDKTSSHWLRCRCYHHESPHLVYRNHAARGCFLYWKYHEASQRHDGCCERPT